MYVYADLLLLVNLVMNGLILWLTGKITSLYLETWRLFSAAFIGAAYAVIAIFPGMHILNALTVKILISLVMVAVCFFPLQKKTLLITLGYFYLISFTVGGAAFGLIYIINANAYLHNGIFYLLNARWSTLVLTSALLLLIGRPCWQFMRKKIWRETMCLPLVVHFDKKQISINALLDTGNQLRDPFSKDPVIVIEYQTLLTILPEEIQRIFEALQVNGLDDFTGMITASAWAARLRLIPFSALGTPKGIMLGFRPDKIEVGNHGDNSVNPKVIIGIYHGKLSPEGAYQALLHPEILTSSVSSAH